MASTALTPQLAHIVDIRHNSSYANAFAIYDFFLVCGLALGIFYFFHLLHIIQTNYNYIYFYFEKKSYTINICYRNIKLYYYKYLRYITNINIKKKNIEQ